MVPVQSYFAMAVVFLAGCADCHHTEPRVKVDNKSESTVTVKVVSEIDTAQFFAILPDHETEWRSFSESDAVIQLCDSAMVVTDSLKLDLRSCHQYELMVDSTIHFRLQEKHRK